MRAFEGGLSANASKRQPSPLSASSKLRLGEKRLSRHTHARYRCRFHHAASKRTAPGPKTRFKGVFATSATPRPPIQSKALSASWG